MKLKTIAFVLALSVSFAVSSVHAETWSGTPAPGMCQTNVNLDCHGPLDPGNLEPGKNYRDDLDTIVPYEQICLSRVEQNSATNVNQLYDLDACPPASAFNDAKLAHA